jgi:hypothetical protein
MKRFLQNNGVKSFALYFFVLVSIKKPLPFLNPFLTLTSPKLKFIPIHKRDYPKQKSPKPLKNALRRF